MRRLTLMTLALMAFLNIAASILSPSILGISLAFLTLYVVYRVVK